MAETRELTITKTFTEIFTARDAYVHAGDLPEGIVGKVTKYCAEVLPNRPGRDTCLDGLTKWVLDGKQGNNKLARIVPRVQAAHPELIGIKS